MKFTRGLMYFLVCFIEYTGLALVALFCHNMLIHILGYNTALIFLALTLLLIIPVVVFISAEPIMKQTFSKNTK